MKPLQAYPSMRAALRELGSDAFVSAVLRSHRRTPPVSIHRPFCVRDRAPLRALAARGARPSLLRRP